MEAADQGRKHVAVLGMVVIVGPVQVRGHHGNVVRPVLAVEELAVLEAGDLRQRIGLVGLLQRAGQQAALRHRLRRQARIDAAGAQEFELLAAVGPGRVDDVHLQDHVVVHEVREGALVGHDAPHLRRRQEHVFRLLGGEEGLHVRLAGEVQLLVRPGDDIRIALALKLPDDGGTHHSAVARHIDFRVFLHHNVPLLLICSSMAPSGKWARSAQTRAR